MAECTVPNGGVVIDGKLQYNLCSEDATYKVGNWLVCDGHKKYYTDVNKWPAEKLEAK